jgi:hypothetical protein
LSERPSRHLVLTQVRFISPQNRITRRRDLHGWLQFHIFSFRGDECPSEPSLQVAFLLLSLCEISLARLVCVISIRLYPLRRDFGSLTGSAHASDPPSVAAPCQLPSDCPAPPRSLPRQFLLPRARKPALRLSHLYPLPKQPCEQVHQACQSWLLFLLALLRRLLAPIRLRVARALRPRLVLTPPHHRAARVGSGFFSALATPDPAFQSSRLRRPGELGRPHSSIARPRAPQANPPLAYPRMIASSTPLLFKCSAALQRGILLLLLGFQCRYKRRPFRRHLWS